ncbi:MAG: histidine phosphatase family protein [Chloroflexota bacterium]
MTAELWLVRHTSTAWSGTRWCGRSDPPLSEAGRTEAHALAGWFSTRLAPPVAIVASRARRAAETADAIARPLDLTASVGADLVEVDLGLIDGLTFDEVAQRHPAVALAVLERRQDIDWPGGESAAEVAARARTASGWLAELASSSTVVAVSHGWFIAALVRALADHPTDALGWSAPGSVVRLSRGPGVVGWSISDRLGPAEGAGTAVRAEPPRTATAR